MHNDMRLSREHIKNLATIISQYKITRKFAAKLLYKHKDTPAKQVKLKVNINIILAELIKLVLIKIVNPSKLEAALKTVSSKQIKLIQLNSFNLNNIYKIVFKFNFKKKYLVFYKFAEGLIFVSESNLVNNDFVNNLNNFINNFVNYIEKNNLTNIIKL